MLRVRWQAIPAAGRQAWPVWLGAAGLVVAALLGIALADGREAQVRWAGMTLQLAGLTTVARGLADTRRLFGLPSVTESVATWLRRLIVRPGSVLAGAATIEAGSATATATAVLLPGPGATFEQRIQSLERRMAAIETEVACAADRLRQRLATLSDERSKERADRTSGDADLRETISQYAVGGLRLERIGLFWLVCGVIATSIPPEIATHL